MRDHILAGFIIQNVTEDRLRILSGRAGNTHKLRGCLVKHFTDGRNPVPPQIVIRYFSARPAFGSSTLILAQPYPVSSYEVPPITTSCTAAAEPPNVS